MSLEHDPRRQRSPHFFGVHAFLGATLIGVNLIAVTGGIARAYEIDSFTNRKQKLQDSLEVVNAEANARIEKGVALTETCNVSELYDNVRNSLNQDSRIAGLVGGLENWAETNPKVDRIKPPRADQSVYAGTPFTDSIMKVGFWLEVFKGDDSGGGKSKMIGGGRGMNGVSAPVFKRVQPQSDTASESETKAKDPTSGALEPVIQINGVRIGVDKLGHFFDQGMEYFKEANTISFLGVVEKPDGLEKALKYGLSTERDGLGLTPSGILSYGDLAANYDGLRFWQKLSAGFDPYVKCIGGRFKLVKPFDFRDYVTDAWDEAINCSAYSKDGASNAMKEQVDRNLKKLKLTCPVEPEKCAALVGSYSAKVLQNIIATECLKHVGGGESSSSVPAASSQGGVQ